MTQEIRLRHELEQAADDLPGARCLASMRAAVLSETVVSSAGDARMNRLMTKEPPGFRGGAHLLGSSQRVASCRGVVIGKENVIINPGPATVRRPPESSKSLTT